MANKHPYISGAGNVAQAINHFRNSLPPTITADTLKKLGLAPNNESYLLGILRFLKIIDSDGNRTDQASKVLSLHSDDDFQKEFSNIVKDAYSDLFDLYGEKAWALDKDALITYFRSTDQTSAVIGQRQAATFQVLAGLCGHGQIPEIKPSTPKRSTSSKASTKSKPNEKPATINPDLASTTMKSGSSEFALTVRVEVNLPADADQETYDRIFKSIRENLINGS